MREYTADSSPQTGEGEGFSTPAGAGTRKEELLIEGRRRAGQFVDLPEGIVKLIYDECAYRNWSVDKLSKKTGLSRPNLFKIISGEGSPTVRTLCRIFKAFGKRLVVGVIDDVDE